jgi:hypothetical protein
MSVARTIKHLIGLGHVYVCSELIPDIEHAQTVVGELAATYLDDPPLLPEDVSGRRDGVVEG